MLAKDMVRLRRHGHTPLIVDPIPEFGIHVGNFVMRTLGAYSIPNRAEAFSNLTVEYPISAYDERLALHLKVFEPLFRDKLAIRIHSADVFCDRARQVCRAKDKKNLFYTDDDHLSHYGAGLLIDMIAAAIDHNREREIATKK